MASNRVSRVMIYKCFRNTRQFATPTSQKEENASSFIGTVFSVHLNIKRQFKCSSLQIMFSCIMVPFLPHRQNHVTGVTPETSKQSFNRILNDLIKQNEKSTFQRRVKKTARIVFRIWCNIGQEYRQKFCNGSPGPLDNAWFCKVLSNLIGISIQSDYCDLPSLVEVYPRLAARNLPQRPSRGQRRRSYH